MRSSYILHNVKETSVRIHDHGWFATIKIMMKSEGSKGWSEFEIFCDSIEDIQNFINSISETSIENAKKIRVPELEAESTRS